MSTSFSNSGYCISFTTPTQDMTSENYGEFRVLSTDMVHAEVLNSFVPILNTVEQRRTALTTQITNGNVAEALSADGQTMETPETLASKYGDFISELRDEAVVIDHKAYDEAKYQCYNFIDYCNSRMDDYNLSEQYKSGNMSYMNIWTEDDKHYDAWKHTRDSVYTILDNINRYNGLDDMFCDESTISSRIAASDPNCGFTLTENYPTHPTSIDSDLSYDRIIEVARGNWTPVKGKTNTYECKVGEGSDAYTYRRVTDNNGKTLYYSATRDASLEDNGYSPNWQKNWAGCGTKFYNITGDVITPDSASHLRKDSTSTTFSIPDFSNPSSIPATSTSSNESLEPLDSDNFIPLDSDEYRQSLLNQVYKNNNIDPDNYDPNRL